MDVIGIIQEAGTNNKLLKMTYRKKKNGEVSERIVEPYEIKGGKRFYGYDTAKDEIRQFIITNIINVQVLDEEFNPRWPIKV